MGLTKEAIFMVIKERCNLSLRTDKDNFSELYIQSNLTKFIKCVNTKPLYTLEIFLSSVQESVFPKYKQTVCKSKDYLYPIRCLKLEIHFLIKILFQVVKILYQVLKAGFIGKWTLRHKCAPGSLFRNTMDICGGQ